MRASAVDGMYAVQTVHTCKIVATKQLPSGPVYIRAVKDGNGKQWRIAELPDGSLVSLTEGRLVRVGCTDIANRTLAVELGPKVSVETLDRLIPRDTVPETAMEDRFSLVANMLGKTSGIVVKTDASISCPSAWYPKARVIKMHPKMPLCYDPVFGHILDRAKLFHEMSHVIFTKHEKEHRGLMEQSKRPKLFATLANLLEDGRIERLLRKAYPGTDPYLRAKAAELAIQYALKGHVLNDLKCKVYLGRYLTPEGRALFSQYDPLIEAAVAAKSSREVWRVAAELTDAIADKLPAVDVTTRCWGITGKKRPNETKKDKKTENEKKDKKTEKEKNEEEYEHPEGCGLVCLVQSEEDPGDSGDGDGESGEDSDAGDSGEDESGDGDSADQEEGKEDDGEDSAEGDSGDGNSGDRASKYRKDQDGPTEEEGEDGEAKDPGGDGGAPGTDGDDITDPELRKAWIEIKQLQASAVGEVRAEAEREYEQLKDEDLERTNELQDLLESEAGQAQELAEILRNWRIEAKRDQYRTVRYGGSFNSRRQVQALTDLPCNRALKEPGDFDFDSVILLDDSGSMDDNLKYEVASSVARVLTAALRKARLLTKPYLFNRGWRSTVPLASFGGGHSTPTARALEAAGNFLAASPARRKVVFLVTDGDPNDADEDFKYTKVAWQALDDAGVTVFGLGIGTGVTPDRLAKQCHLPLILKDVQDLQDALPRLLLDFAEEEVYSL